MSNEDFKTLPLETLAELLTDIADGLTTREYTRVLEDVLDDMDSSRVARIAEYMSPDLQCLLPKKYLSSQLSLSAKGLVGKQGI